MLPEVGASRPVSILMVVDLPAPLGPRKPKNWPGATVRLTSWTAVNSPKRRVRPVVETAGIMWVKNTLATMRVSRKVCQVAKNERETSKEAGLEKNAGRPRGLIYLKAAAIFTGLTVRHVFWAGRAAAVSGLQNRV